MSQPTNSEYQPRIVTGHLYGMMNPVHMRDTVAAALECLRRFDFDAIAFRGMSGALVAPVLALNLNKTLILVRKPDDHHHGWDDIEGHKAARRYVILDDFVSSGDTIRAIFHAVAKFAPQAVCLGVCETNCPTRAS